MSVSQRSRRVSFFRKWSLRIGLLAASAAVTGIAFLPKASRGNDYTVTHTGDSGAGSLRDAIEQANLAGAGNHTISFDSGLAPNSLVQLASELEHVQVNIVIDGGGHTLSGHNNHEIFFVALGNVTIKNFTLQDGNSSGGNGGSTNLAGGGGGGLGAGGAIFVDSGANVVVQNITFANNAAQGGNGGNVNGIGTSAGGGGGGGFSANGGDGGYDGGGGGGGFLGTGGNGSASSSGGGGGGGLLGNGGSGSNTFSGTGGGGGGGAVLSGADGFSSLGGAGGGITGGNGGNSGGNGADAFPTGGGGGGGNGADGGTGGDFGGGGGAGGGGTGGTGGDLGGGGGGGYSGDAGDGGFGGGSGGAGFSGNEGTPGFGGGQGGATYTGGAGGDGLGGAIFVRSGGSLTVINSTFTNNTVAVGNGGSGNVYNGANGNADGSAVYVMTGTTLNFSVTSNGNITVADTIGGGGEVKKLGTGELILTGANTYTGATTVDAGRLAINGSVTSNVTVNGGGTLGGNGDITGNLLNDGIVAPGNSIGRLDVIGSYTQNANSQLQIEIDDAGNNDLIAVQGNAQINGGIVAVTSAPGNYSPGMMYTFLSTTTGYNGAFSGITDDLAFLDAVFYYGNYEVSFILQPNQNDFIDIAQTFNQIQVATVFDANTGSALQPIADEMYLMTDSQVRYSLDQMSGEVYGTTAQIQFQNTTNQFQQLAQQLRPNLGLGGFETAATTRLPASNEMLVSFDRAGELVVRGQNECVPAHTTWATGYGLGGNAQTDGNASGLNYGLGGVQAGIDRTLNEETLVGAYGGYNYGQIDGTNLTQRVQANSGQFGAYYRRETNCDYYLLASGMSFDAYNSSRTISIGAFNAVASANYDGWQSATYLERGRTYSNGLGMLQPYAALQYIYLRQNSFSETGGGAAGLDVAGVDANSLRGILGTRASREFTTANGLVFVPQVRAAWLHEFLETNTLINNRFGSVAGSSFAAQGLDLGRDWALLGGGLGWRMTDQLTLTGNYDAQVNERQVFHVGSANVQYMW